MLWGKGEEESGALIAEKKEETKKRPEKEGIQRRKFGREGDNWVSRNERNIEANSTIAESNSFYDSYELQE